MYKNTEKLTHRKGTQEKVSTKAPFHFRDDLKRDPI